MAYFVASAELEGGRLARQRRIRDRKFRHQERRDPGRHPLAAQEEMEMAVLGRRRRALPGRPGVAMVEILGVAGWVVDLALGIVPPITHIGRDIGCAWASHLADDSAAA